MKLHPPSGRMRRRRQPADGEVAISPQAFARRWKTLVILSLSLLVIGLDNTILNVALPSLQKEFDASGSTLQWIVDSYLLAFAGLLLTMGTLGDRFGRKLALQVGLGLFGAASLAVLLVDSAGELIAVRALMGVGAALIMPATLSIITNVFPREERAKAIGIWSAMAALGVGLGPLLGGLLLEWFDWTSVFLVNVPVAAAAIALGFWLVPESRDPKPGRFDFLGAGLSTATLGVLVYGLIEAPARGWTSPLILSCFAAAALLATAFVRWELRTPEPMLQLAFFRNPRFSVASLAIGVAFFSLFGAIFATTQYLQDAHGYSALEAGAAMVPVAFGLMMGAGSSTLRLVPHLGTTRVVMAGLLGLGGLLATTLLWGPDMPYWPLGLWFFFVAFSMGWVMAPSTASVMGSVPRDAPRVFGNGVDDTWSASVAKKLMTASTSLRCQAFSNARAVRNFSARSAPCVIRLRMNFGSRLSFDTVPSDQDNSIRRTTMGLYRPFGASSLSSRS